jgi:hypothetical protein
MMPTLQAQINRTNAQHSTGPKTKAGKRRSSLNALRHGLTGQTIVLPSDDLEAYRQHVESFVDEYRPNGATESHLVQTLADTAWRQNRVAALETNLLTLGIVRETDPPNNLPKPVQQALAIAASLDSQTRALSNLSIHGQRLTRQFEKTLALLQKLQSERQIEPELRVNQAASPVQMHALKDEPYGPAEDGFVFSEAFTLANHVSEQAHQADSHCQVQQEYRNAA